MRRTRSRGNGHGGNPNAGGSQPQRRTGVPNRHQVYDSNGPEIRIRGNAWQVCEKYQAMARDAQAAGDRVKAENYLQHAEHYYRIILSIQEAMGENIPAPRTTADDLSDNMVQGSETEMMIQGQQPHHAPIQDPALMPQPTTVDFAQPTRLEAAVA